MFRAPQPRSWLYTTTTAYAKAATAVVSGIGYSGTGAKELERDLEGLFPNFYAVAVPMARVGIYLTLKQTIKPGQKVVLSSYTISDVVNMVLCAGGVPLFVDIEPHGSFNLDVDCVKDVLEAHHDVGAVLATHFYGLICDIERLTELCNDKGIPVIEDAAQSFGAKLDGKLAGSFGHAGVFSFGLLKNVTGFFGGAVITQDAALAAGIRDELRQWTLFPRMLLAKKMFTGANFDIATTPVVFDIVVYWLFRFSYLHGLSFFNNKLDTDANPVSYSALPSKYAHQMSSAQGNIIRTQFDGVEGHTRERIAKAQLYHEDLRDIPDLVLPPLRTDGSHNYFYYAIQSEDRDRLVRSMTQKLRDVQISHHRNCAGLACFSAFYRECPNAARAERGVVYLPTYPGYREDQVRANIESIRGYYREGN
jgi:perosamine synthetase